MTDFSRFSRVTTDTARFTFHELEGEPWIAMKPATAANRPYLNALIKANGGRARRRRITAETYGKNQRQDIGLYAQHVVTAWGNVFDNQGTAVDLSPETCKDFLSAIPDYMFDEARDFATDPESYTTSEDEDGDGESAPKN